MFRCDRCGSSYNPMHAAVTENCPRCLLRDRVEAPLTFKLFRLSLDGGDEVEEMRAHAGAPASEGPQGDDAATARRSEGSPA